MNTHPWSTIRFQSLLAALTVCLACAGCSWRQADRTSPAARRGHAMAFDSANNQILLFSGNASVTGASGDTGVNDTWEWDGLAWTKKFPATMPPALYKAAMACDSIRHRVVLFGGAGGGHEVNDTWEWDGNNWQQLFPAHRPPPRHHHAMAYDSNRKVVVLFGGFISTGDSANPDELIGPLGTADLGDTWEWNGTDWKQCSPATPPPPRDGHGLAYDEKRQVIVLFGGVQDVRNPFTLLKDTWTWDGVNWKNVTSSNPAKNPPPRGNVAMAYNSRNQKVMIFGGYDGLAKAYFDDTWKGNETAWWQKHGNSPTARNEHAMAYDPVRRRMVLFGGYSPNNLGKIDYLGDTWELR